MNNSTLPFAPINHLQGHSTVLPFRKISSEERFSKLQEFRFDITKPIEQPEAYIAIAGHIVSTKGNLTTLAGQAKAGKSGFLSAVLTGVLTLPGHTPDIIGLTINSKPDGKALLHIDGEQSRYDHYRGLKRVLQRASRTKVPDWFHSYNLRELEIPERRKVLKFLCEELAKRHGGIQLIVLDGGADFVQDINDLKESNEVVKFFETLAMEYECPVIIVLHFNPGSDKGRGHFGSQLERKSESVISVTKDKDSEISTIEGKFLRNTGNLPNLQFRYDPEKGHHVYHSFKAKLTKAAVKEDGLHKLADEVCPDTSRLYTYSELCGLIVASISVSEPTAKNRIKDLVEKGLLLKNKDGKYYRAGLSSHSIKVV